MPGSAARSIRHFAQHRERAQSVIIHDAPRPVGTEIGDEHLSASREGYDLVWMRALLAGSVGAGTIQLQHCARWCKGVNVIEEVWGRAGQRGGQDRPGIVLYILARNTAMRRPHKRDKQKNVTYAQDSHSRRKGPPSSQATNRGSHHHLGFLRLLCRCQSRRL